MLSDEIMLLRSIWASSCRGKNCIGICKYRKPCTCNASTFCDSTAATKASHRPRDPPIGVALLPKESMQGSSLVAQCGHDGHIRNPRRLGSTVRVITRKAYTQHNQCNDLDNLTGVFPRFGDHSASETPGPIPNPAVKHRSADGTAS